MGLFIFPCAGNAGLLPLNLYARVRFSLCISHTRPRVQRAPGIPCSLSSTRDDVQSSLGHRAARTQMHVNYLNFRSNGPSVIASQRVGAKRRAMTGSTKQSIIPPGTHGL